MKVFASTVINTPADKVWDVLRNFIGLTAWSNVVTDARIANDLASNQTGAIRELTIADGSVFRETLIAISDEEHFLQYDIVDGPLPVSGYVATMGVTPVTDNNSSFVYWMATFDAAPDDAPAMREVVGEQICAAGLAALKEYLEA